MQVHLLWSIKLPISTSQLKRLGFPCRIRKFDDVHAIAVNTAEKGSFIFETVKNNYEVGIVFALNAKGKMEYSIYRLGENPEKQLWLIKSPNPSVVVVMPPLLVGLLTALL